MYNKILKTSLPVIWMGLIFYLSNQPYNFFIIKATSIEQILAHIFLYAVLSYLLIFALTGQEKKWQLKNILLFSVLFSIFYGITDEYHQGFITGRFVSFLDLVFDAIGAFLSAFLYYVIFKNKKLKLLLHICCVGCGIYIVDVLKKDYDIVLYFNNPNIYPGKEHKTRLGEAKKISKKLGLKLIVGEYNHTKWLELVKGLENETEGGKRCLVCYKYRLNEVAKLSKNKKFDYFTTTLTVSPHKNAKSINKIGKELENKYKIKFLERDFKKQDGFKKSCELSKKLGLYRQDYCGCEFSQR